MILKRKKKAQLKYELEIWKPSPNMKKVFEIAVNSESENITKWFTQAGIDRASWNAWIKNEKFIEWWNKEWGKAMRAAKTYLDKIGLENAKTDFRYWEAMEKMYGGYQVERGPAMPNIIFNIPRPVEREVIESESI